MTDSTLLGQALQLPEEERRALAEALAASLSHDRLSPSVQSLLDERLADMTANPATGRAWDDVRRDLLETHLL